jgi:hypothetical protein
MAGVHSGFEQDKERQRSRSIMLGISSSLAIGTARRGKGAIVNVLDAYCVCSSAPNLHPLMRDRVVGLENREGCLKIHLFLDDLVTITDE